MIQPLKTGPTPAACSGLVELAAGIVRRELPDKPAFVQHTTTLRLSATLHNMHKPNRQPSPIAAQLLTTAEVARLVGYTPRTIIRWAELGRHGFPQPAIAGGRGAGHRWHSDDIAHWLKSIRTT